MNADETVGTGKVERFNKIHNNAMQRIAESACFR
jgi:hypothetical protein